MYFIHIRYDVFLEIQVIKPGITLPLMAKRCKDIIFFRLPKKKCRKNTYC